MNFKSDSLNSHNAEWASRIGQHESDDDFLSYFDTAASADSAYMQGFWDFSFHILKPEMLELIGEPFGKEVLEIGFGGGRLLNAARRFFGHAYGVDIHEAFDRVDALLARSGPGNYSLLKGNGNNIPRPDSSIDLVYSFIVLQHLPFIETVESYLAESFRVLRPGGAAILYFGYLSPLSRHSYLDLHIRPIADSRDNSLVLKASKARKLMKDAGFEVRHMARSRKKPWLRTSGQQNYLIARKPEAIGAA